LIVCDFWVEVRSDSHLLIYENFVRNSAKTVYRWNFAQSSFSANNLVCRMTVALGDQAEPPDERRVAKPFLGTGFDSVRDPKVRLVL
jgi:hypothetical protein